MKLRSFFRIALVLSLIPEVYAEPRVAPEFTVTRKGMGSKDRGEADQVESDLKKWRALAEELCAREPDCEGVLNGNGFSVRFTILFKDKTWLKVTTDPGVFEMKMPWQPLRWWREHESRVQKFAFDLPKQIGLSPSAQVGMGHLTHEFASTFGDDVFLFRQYIADRFNNPQLALGILEDDMRNASPLAHLTPYHKGVLLRALEKVDRGETQTTEQFLTDLLELSSEYKKSELRFPTELPKPGEKVSGMLHNLEDRAQRAQRSARDFTLLADLKLARIEYLKKIKTPIPLKDILGKETRLSKAESVYAFRGYVESAGKDIEDYAPFIPSDWAVDDPKIRRILRGEETSFDVDGFKKGGRSIKISDPEITSAILNEAPERWNIELTESVLGVKERLKNAKTPEDFFLALDVNQYPEGAVVKEYIRMVQLGQDAQRLFEGLKPSRRDRKKFERLGVDGNCQESKKWFARIFSGLL